MSRIRFLRILLPVLLIVLGVILWNSLEPRTAVRSPPIPTVNGDAPRATGLSFVDFDGPDGSRSAAGHADVLEPGQDGSLHLEGIRRLEIQREDREPLIVSAMRGDREGDAGRQRWSFEDQVVFQEIEAGLKLSLPSLEIDEQAGEARSEGPIRFEAPDLRGEATGLVYGLRGQPGELTSPTFEDSQAGRVTALRARLLDGLRDVELLGEVSAIREGQRLDAGSMRLIRDERLRWATADGGVEGSWATVDGPTMEVRSERLDIRWDDRGELTRIDLSGNAMLSRAEESLAAETIEARRQRHEENLWEVVATEGVYLQGRFGPTPGLLHADSVTATFGGNWDVRWASAHGRVTYESGATRAEAVRASFAGSDEPGGGRIELIGDERREARLARGRTRIAAESIHTDTHGDRLTANRRVEATVLPQAAAGSGEGISLFVASEAVHFVSEHMDSRHSGAQLTFTGSVRGWQGERNLAAKRIEIDQVANTLEARDAVTTRIPRERGTATVAEGDYIQIAADQLSYDDAERRAVYVGQVRVRFAEGWLEAERVEIDLDPATRKVSEIRAAGAIRLEVHRNSEGEIPHPMAGSSDRLRYRPADGTLELFGEDQAPASVRRIGEGGGTTIGRVLTYRLDTGSLDVESGDQGTGRIVTSGS